MNSWLRTFSLFLRFFSFSALSDCFFILSLFFSGISRLFQFLQHHFLFFFNKISNVCWFLFLLYFYRQMDLCLAAQFSFVFVPFEVHLKLTFQIKTVSFAVAIDIRTDHRIYVLKNCFVFSKIFS